MDDLAKSVGFEHFNSKTLVITGRDNRLSTGNPITFSRFQVIPDTPEKNISPGSVQVR